MSVYVVGWLFVRNPLEESEIEKYGENGGGKNTVIAERCKRGRGQDAKGSSDRTRSLLDPLP